MTSFKEECSEYIKTGQSLSKQEDKVNFYIENIKECICNGGKIILCGNGGSAADSIHIAGEFVGRFKKDRKSLPAISLSAEVSSLTSIGNDYGFEFLLERNLRALGKKGDTLICISTSGNSKNLILAADCARNLGIRVIGLLGNKGGHLCKKCNLSLLYHPQKLLEYKKHILRLVTL